MYLGPNGKDAVENDDRPGRLQRALEAGDLDEAEHVSAVMVGVLHGRGNAQAKFCAEQWSQAFGKDEPDGE